MKRKTTEAARGKWRGILLQLGVDGRFLTGKHGPCPMCEGHDRFRWDNKGGNGSWICSQCGAGDGMELLKRLKNWDFITAAREVDKIVGNVESEPVAKPIDTDKRRQLLNELWKKTAPLADGDPVSAYFQARKLDMPKSRDIRVSPLCRSPDGSEHPAMIALVRDASGKPVTIHRTYLGHGRKADIEQPRALMPGEIPDGACVHLFEQSSHIGIAEGIETALAAAKLWDVPTWAALNSAMMSKWIPPAGVERVTVFGDNDKKFGGQASAFALAHRLAVKGLEVDVRIPSTAGFDWADIAEGKI